MASDLAVDRARPASARNSARRAAGVEATVTLGRTLAQMLSAKLAGMIGNDRLCPTLAISFPPEYSSPFVLAQAAHLGEDIPLAEPWASVEEVAKHLGVAKDSVYRWIDHRGLPAHKIGRLWKFKLSEVDHWVRAGGADAQDGEKDTAQ